MAGQFGCSNCRKKIWRRRKFRAEPKEWWKETPHWEEISPHR
jgi:hypothetical protein